jgi:hypothetical protein
MSARYRDDRVNRRCSTRSAPRATPLVARSLGSVSQSHPEPATSTTCYNGVAIRIDIAAFV